MCGGKIIGVWLEEINSLDPHAFHTCRIEVFANFGHMRCKNYMCFDSFRSNSNNSAKTDVGFAGEPAKVSPSVK